MHRICFYSQIDDEQLIGFHWQRKEDTQTNIKRAIVVFDKNVKRNEP